MDAREFDFNDECPPERIVLPKGDFERLTKRLAEPGRVIPQLRDMFRRKSVLELSAVVLTDEEAGATVCLRGEDDAEWNAILQKPEVAEALERAKMALERSRERRGTAE